jgi:hypothetical protein
MLEGVGIPSGRGERIGNTESQQEASGKSNSIRTPVGKLDSEPSTKVDLSKSDLTDQQRFDLQKLLNEYTHVFSQSQFELGYTEIVRHHIKVPDTQTPIRSVPHRIPD